MRAITAISVKTMRQHVESPVVRASAHGARLGLHERMEGDEVRRETEQREDACEPEADVPAVHLRENSAHERSDDRAEVDPPREDREATRVAVRIILGVECADLARDVSP